MIRKMCLLLAVAGIAGVASFSSYRAATSAQLDLEEILGPISMPAPRDSEIAYDTPPLLPIFQMDNTSRYWAVLFNIWLPDTVCSLKAGLVEVVVAGAPPVCSFFVWSDNAGVLVEPPVFRQQFTASAFSPWDTIQVSPVHVCSNAVWLGCWVPNIGMDPLEQDLIGCDQAPPPPSGVSLYSTNRVSWMPVAAGFPGRADLGIRARVTFFERPLHDVKPVAVLAPGDSVVCDTSYSVQASVRNNGDQAETFNFTCRIDTAGAPAPLFNQTRNVSNLGAGQTRTVDFSPPAFLVPRRDNIYYSMKVYTSLLPDDSTGNDTLVDSTFGHCIWNHDVAPVALIQPGDSVWCDSTVNVIATVRNLGDLAESFYFKIFIDSVGGRVYSESVAVNLNAGQTSPRGFPSWHVPVADGKNWTFRLITTLPGDMNPANDTVIDYSFGRCYRDVGALSVVVPEDTVYCDSSYAPEAVVVNYGPVSESFLAEFLIDGGTTYGDTQSVVNLLPHDSTSVFFAPPWLVPMANGVTYDITLRTISAQDRNTSNNMRADSTLGLCLGRDVSPVSVLWPPDTVYCDSSGDVAALVTNLGPVSESFSVEALIETLGTGIYAETTDVVDLAPAETVSVFFPQWVVPNRDMLDYSVTVTTLLPGDSDPGNDALAVTSHGLCPFHDCGVVSIDGPPDSVYVDSVYAPLATVENFGNRTESFDVVCTIDGYADTASVAGLAPGLTDQVTFADWTVPSVGPFTICMKALLGGDGEPANDSICQTIETYVGAEELRVGPSVPRTTQILGNTPNPFSKRTRVEYGTAEPGKVTLMVYDALGRLVTVLVDETMVPGWHAVEWDGRDDHGSIASNGVYFFKLVCGNKVESKKSVLVR